VTCDLGTLGVGASATVTIAVTPTVPGTASNTATVAAAESDPEPANNAATQATTVNALTVDLAVTKAGAPDPVAIGANVTWTITVVNNGPGAATGVVVTDVLPGSVTLVSVSASQGTCTGSQALTCEIGSLAVGGSATVTVVVTVHGGSQALNSATVAGSEVDPDATNNSVTARVRVRGPDLVTTAVSDPPGTAAAGAAFAVTDTVRNRGFSAAGETITRYYLSADAERGAGDLRLQPTRAVPALAPNAESTGTVTVRVPAGAAAGAYYLLACADDRRVVDELNERNNCAASAARVTIGP
jgi:uncharacterized repeat protein (TIGR01451 family)